MDSVWDEFDYPAEARQRRPEPRFYLTSLPAGLLYRLSNVPRRGEPRRDEKNVERQVAEGPRIADTNIQRGFTQERSQEIGRYIFGGYPWAALAQRDRAKYIGSRKPGLLPTAIIVNVLAPGSIRMGHELAANDAVELAVDRRGHAELVVPDAANAPDWTPQGLRPINIIDGQHRLMAFDPALKRVGDDPRPPDEFPFPVVLFHDLDVSWEAYLFWTINIRPKRISPSLAFDLYPLLRNQDWLEPIQGPKAYRESRAQELTEALWSHPSSP